MSISPITTNQSQLLQRLSEMRQQYNDLEKQLATGVRADTYGGLGAGRGLDVALRARSTEVSAWQNSITHLDLRLSVVDTALGRMSDLATEVRSAADPNVYNVLSDGTTSAQIIAKGALSELVGLLNTDVAGRYVFAGREVDKSPVEAVETILNGDGTRAGFTQVADERRQADLGPNGQGRVNATTAGAVVSIDEDGSHPFGFKLTGATSTLSNVTLTAPSGDPATMSVDFTGQPELGETLRVHADLPDGTSTIIELTVSADGSEPNSFQIGATPADTAANFEAAMNTALASEAATTLSAASLMRASEDFFNTEGGAAPQRVDGPPFDTATAMRSGAADTVTWYTGENNANNPRSSVTARVDETLSVSYGVRANEEGFRTIIQSLAAYSVESFAADDATDKARYQALTERIDASLTVRDGVQNVQTIQIEMATTHYIVDSAKDRHQATAGTLTEMIEDIERANIEEVAAALLTLQTRMQASYQTTAMLSEMSLVNFI